MCITSLDNSRVKEWVKLQDKRYRDKTNTFIVEGEHIVEEALKNQLLTELILEEGTKVPFEFENTFYVTKEVMKKISTLESPVSVMGRCRKKEIADFKHFKRIVLLDGIQDPGNLGTIIRSAEAFNVDCIILSDDTVDLYNPKVVRATQGLLFSIPIIRTDLFAAIQQLKEQLVPIYATNVQSGCDVHELNNEEKLSYAIVMGNEGNGVRPTIMDLCDKYIYITMKSTVESLNVSIATSILLYELNRRN